MIFGGNIPNSIYNKTITTYATCVRLLLIEHRFFKFKNEVKKIYISTMQQLKHNESHKLCDGIKLLLSNFASNYLSRRSGCVM